ncbi:unnamed protein product [Allacma fusca]|uniref:Uncharacterized protein n=1 Tax=Allacma fusca TaxID=39272 RepID=A0A8J2LPY4_9HEXA|nr:unnamed protein product [Allacma fusca]
MFEAYDGLCLSLLIFKLPEATGKMKSMTCVAVGLLFLLGYTRAGIVSGTKKSDPPSFTGNTVTTTSSNAAPPPASRSPYGSFGSRYGNPGPAAPLGGGFGGPFGGFPGFPGFGAGGNVGLDVGIGGGLIEKAIVVVGGGILILLGFACVGVSMGKGGYLNNLGKSFAGSNAGSKSRIVYSPRSPRIGFILPAGLVDWSYCQGSGLFPNTVRKRITESHCVLVIMLDPVVAREKQYHYLISILQKSIVIPSAVLAWGPNSSGKSTVVEKALADSKIRNVATVNARELLCGQGQFLVAIIHQLFQHMDNLDLKNLKCDSTGAFINELCQLRTKVNFGSDPFVVVIEKAETLRDEHGDLIEVLSRMQDMVQFNICVIFLSSLPFSSFSCFVDLKQMVIIDFPQYNKDEVTAILIKEAPPTLNRELYEFHIKMTLSIFYMACRDLRKLHRLAILNFEKFANEVNETDTRISLKKMQELWKLMQPQLMKDFKTLKANVIPDHDVEESDGKCEEHKHKNVHQFPKYVKYLLVSAYLATHNPASSDRRFFVKAQLGRKRRKVANPCTGKSYELQYFTLPRLFAIYEFLTDNNGPKNQLMLSQLTNLCQLQLLEKVINPAAPLDEPKFKCLTSLEFIEDVGSSVDMDIKKYLYRYI